ncbi:unnamed protein product, partial [Polarella glacialis]
FHSATNAKTTLVELCQRYLGKSMDKGDITYEVVEHDGGRFQAIVTVLCISGLQFAGLLGPSFRAAEQTAALQAIEGVRAEIGRLGSRKRKASEAFDEVSDDMSEALNAPAPDVTMKNKLRVAVKQVMGRDLTDADIVYDTTEVDGGFQTMVTVPNLPEPLAGRSWNGPVSPFRRDTGLLAAQDALEEVVALGTPIDLSRVL